jgi:hypothetical protein
MQLINSAVYDKEKQARAKAMEETRKLKEQRRTDREQSKVLRYAQGPAGASVSTSSQQIIVNDVPFKVVRGGSKLIRISSMSLLNPLVLSGTGSPVLDDPNTANTTPKRVTVAGVTFVRSKNGNLHRLGAVASKKYVPLPSIETFSLTILRQPGAAKKRNELCKRFTTTGILISGDPFRPAITIYYDLETNTLTLILQVHATKDHHVFLLTTQAKLLSAKTSSRQASAAQVLAVIFPMSHRPTAPPLVCTS